MRVLFASTRGAGHFDPLVPFIEASRRQGHEVLLAGPPALAPAVEAAGYPAVERVLAGDAYAVAARRIADEMGGLPAIDDAFVA